MADERSDSVVSFTFSSKSNRVKLASPTLRDDSAKADNEETDYVESLEAHQINVTVKKKEKVDLMIPMSSCKQLWKIPASSALPAAAVLETERRRYDDQKPADESREPKTPNLDEIAAREVLKDALRAHDEVVDERSPSVIEVPLLMQNRLPVDMEDKLDTLLPESSSLGDYEAVPIEDYGMAMLRGMGWKANEGIGTIKNNRPNPAVMSVTVRPKGLGLGADRSVLDKCKESGRVLNKSKYEEYKLKQREANEEADAEEERRWKKRSSRGLSRSCSRRGEREQLDRDPRQLWLFPSLRVRCIDPAFKAGKYYKRKMDVIDVISHRLCFCRADDGALLDSVPVSALETVIPRQEPAYVMVVAGENKGQVCEVIGHDRQRSRATIQTLTDRQVHQVSYDYICQYIGPV